MPNWCDTVAIFTGDEEDVKKASEVIEKLYYVPDSTNPGSGWLGWLMPFIYPDKFDFDGMMKELKDNPESEHTSIKLKYIDGYPDVARRGWIQNFEVYPISKKPGATCKNDAWCLELTIMDAWGPHFKIMQYFALKYGLTLNCSWEEPGMCLYGKLDPDNVFLWPDWCIDVCLPDFEDKFYCSDAELSNPGIGWPESFLQYLEDNNIVLSTENILDTVGKFMEYAEGNIPGFDEYDHWFYVHRFEHDDITLPKSIPDLEPIENK